jgi:hypothetical protein
MQTVAPLPARCALVVLLLGLQTEACLVAIPYVLASLIALDSLGASWLGAMTAVGLFAAVMLAACFAVPAAAAGERKPATTLFASAWCVYNIAGLAMLVTIS